MGRNNKLVKWDSGRKLSRRDRRKLDKIEKDMAFIAEAVKSCEYWRSEQYRQVFEVVTQGLEEAYETVWRNGVMTSTDLDKFESLKQRLFQRIKEDLDIGDAALRYILEQEFEQVVKRHPLRDSPRFPQLRG